jgi:hypothetical protein
MKLIREVVNHPDIKKRYLLLEGVNDMDAVILELCNMERNIELDEDDPENGTYYEAWQVL